MRTSVPTLGFPQTHCAGCGKVFCDSRVVAARHEVTHESRGHVIGFFVCAWCEVRMHRGWGDLAEVRAAVLRRAGKAHSATSDYTKELIRKMD